MRHFTFVLSLSSAIFCGCASYQNPSRTKDRSVASEPVSLCQDLDLLKSTLAQLRENTENFKSQLKDAKNLREIVVAEEYKKLGSDITLVERATSKGLMRRLNHHSDILLSHELLNPEVLARKRASSSSHQFFGTYLGYIGNCGNSECNTDFAEKKDHSQQVTKIHESRSGRYNPSPLASESLNRIMGETSNEKSDPLVLWLLAQAPQSVSFSDLVKKSTELRNGNLVEGLGVLGLIFSTERLRAPNRKTQALLGNRMKPLFCDIDIDPVGYNYHFWAYLNLGLVDGGWKEKTFNFWLQIIYERDEGDYLANKYGLDIGVELHRGTLQLIPEIDGDNTKSRP